MPQPHATAHSASQIIAQRIEQLYGQPLAHLEALAETNPRDSMLAALTGTHTELALAERNIAFQRDRLRELASSEREIGRFEAGHILDCARRLADSVAARDAYAKSVGAVLGGLRRISGPNTHPPAAPAPATPAPATSRTR
ncbi:hypothetical protein [Streptomyces silvisoli]|uniref:Uncharacterized protein n=1 Tax=Streptomyces silvisoli TaxID=3034235 RepID=A0ABT5ZS82_9ACTN|nr:hypothetical protein [Streptomyces silvisoli]MDF3292435.1 hypothetical protein [Streptomyces silvisoli]